MEIGQTVKALVTQIENFGIFFDSGGNKILVTIPEISWHRINHPSDFTEIGNEHEILILNIQNDKISGSIKQTKPDENPWKNAHLYEVGSIHKGIVKKNYIYGTFLEIFKGPEVLLKNEYGGGNLKIGDTINLEILFCEPGYKLEAKIKT